MNVIDAHVHIQPWKMIKPAHLAMMQGKRPDIPQLTEIMYSPEKLIAHLDRERIERIVSINYVSPEIMGFTEEVNAYAADYAKRCDGRQTRWKGSFRSSVTSNSRTSAPAAMNTSTRPSRNKAKPPSASVSNSSMRMLGLAAR